MALTILAAENKLNRTFVRETSVVLGASLFIAALAQITVPLPFTPVPFTLQTLGLYLVASVLGPKRGAMAVAAYLAEGCAGLPVFSAGSFGAAALAGPTGGYLLGFVPAAFVAGAAAERGRLISVLAFGGAAVTLYAAGVMQLSFFVPKTVLFTAGLWPFVPGEAVKVLLAAAMLPAFKKLAGRI